MASNSAIAFRHPALSPAANRARANFMMINYGLDKETIQRLYKTEN